MIESPYPRPTHGIVAERRRLAPEADAAFRQLGEAVFRDGALPARTKQLIAVAAAHVTQCPYCIEAHVKAAARAGASREEIMEAVWVAAEMRAGAAFAHSTVALATLEAVDRTSGPAGEGA